MQPRNMPALDDTWTWEAWALAQVAADPGKKPYSPDEIAHLVKRGYAAGLRPMVMQEMLCIPERKIAELRHTQTPDDPWLRELRELTVFSSATARYNLKSTSRLAMQTSAEQNRLTELRELLHRQFQHIIDVADPELFEVKDGNRGWLGEEVIVEHYFNALKAQVAGDAQAASVSVEGLNQRVIYCGISCLLSDLGLTWLVGFPPGVAFVSGHLARLVSDQLTSAPALAASLDAAPASLENVTPDPQAVFVAPLARTENELPQTATGTRKVRYQNRADADARNKKLGDAGEAFVVEVEKQRLIQAGRPDLADQVEWTARIRGDGAGYDVSSFNDDGSPRLIEVKTTNGDQNTSFYVTANELRASGEFGGSYWLYRVFVMNSEQPRIYCLQGSLADGNVTLVPTVYRATR